MRSKIPIFIFIYFLILQILNTYSLDYEKLRFLRFGLFEFGFVLACIYVVIDVLNYLPQKNNRENNFVITVILIYTAYQIFYIFPTLHSRGLSYTAILGSNIFKLYFLLIPFFYFRLIPSFNDIEIPIKWIISSAIIILFLFIYNYSIGKYMLTDTGQLRIAPGTVAVLFVFTLVYSFSLFSGNKDKPLLIIAAIIGVVMANHRTAYLGIGIIFLISIVNIKRLGQKIRLVILGLLLLAIIFVTMSQIPLIYDNFIGRVTTSLNTKDETAQIRFNNWQQSWEYFLRNPINGSMLPGKYYIYNFNKVPPHSIIMEILSTQGIVGLIFIMTILFSILRIAYKNRMDAISFQMFLVLVFYISFAMANVTFFDERNIIILLFGSGVVLYRNHFLLNILQQNNSENEELYLKNPDEFVIEKNSHLNSI